MTTSRDKALAELKRLIAERRSDLDPRLLDMARKALAGRGAETAGATVPYDRDNATRAIELFLRDHDDRKGFQQRLLELIRKSQH